MNIKEMITNKKVFFVKYQQKELIYKTECGFEFPIPLSDTGDAAFLSEDKAIFFMRWIRLHINTIEQARIAQNA